MPGAPNSILNSTSHQGLLATAGAVRIVNPSTAASSLALWVTSAIFHCNAAAAIHGSENEIGLPFLAHPLLIRAHWPAVSASGKSGFETGKKPAHELPPPDSPALRLHAVLEFGQRDQ
jgi:hypothetical protein